MKKKFIGKCDGKRVTFKQLKEAKPSTPTATAQITTPAPADIDSNTDEIAQIFSEMHTQNDEFGYRGNVAGFSIDRVITEETIPNYEVLKETEFVADKSCIICLKSNMDLNGLSLHIQLYHGLTFNDEGNNDPLDYWEICANDWDEEGLIYSDSDKERVEQSDEEQQIILDTSLFDKKSFSERHSNSSSDSSSSVKSSKSKSRKKSRKVRDNEILL